MREQIEYRAEKGRLQAERFSAYAARSDEAVPSLPRSGAPLALEIANRVQAPLDISWLKGSESLVLSNWDQAMVGGEQFR